MFPWSCARCGIWEHLDRPHTKAQISFAIVVVFGPVCSRTEVDKEAEASKDEKGKVAAEAIVSGLTYREHIVPLAIMYLDTDAS